MKARMLSVVECNLGLTRRQKQCLDFIKGYSEGLSPTYETIAKGIGLRDKARVHYLVAGLVERGHLRRVQYFVVERIKDEARLVPLRNKRELHVKRRQSEASKLGWRRRQSA